MTRRIYVVDYADDASGSHSQEFYGTEARARAALRRAGFTPEPDFPNQFYLGESTDQPTQRAHLHSRRVR